MARLVEVVLEDREWAALDLADRAERAARATLRHLNVAPEGVAISLLGCDDARIAKLNRQFRAEPKPTNVLSWPSEDRAAERPGGMPDLPGRDRRTQPVELGDIAISRGVCLRESAEAGRSPGDHVTHLLVHAVLHLLGFDHANEADARLMEGFESEILAGLGIADPYSEQV